MNATDKLRNLESWLTHIERLHPQGKDGINPGLERCQVVSAHLHQQKPCPLIVVGGTNGKGSTCAFLESICRAAGYRTGCYTSPHFETYNERVRLDGLPADDIALCIAFEQVEKARALAGISLTYFEFGTLAAWECMCAAQVEVIILEVGLGGRLDATNLYDTDVAIVTGVALDHTEWLGHDREAIGLEKAGIFRTTRPAICSDPNPPASLLQHAGSIDADLRLVGRDFGYQSDALMRNAWHYWHRSKKNGKTGVRKRLDFAWPGLRGRQQLANASAAITALVCLDELLPVSTQALREGLLRTSLPGRFQVLPGRCVRVIDVAHNAQATQALADNLADMGYFRHNIAVVGMLADKDIDAALRPLIALIDRWLLCQLPSSRSETTASLEAVLQKLGAERTTRPGNTSANKTLSVQHCNSPAEALRKAEESAGENDRIVVFGSFYTVAGALAFANGSMSQEPGREPKS